MFKVSIALNQRTHSYGLYEEVALLPLPESQSLLNQRTHSYAGADYAGCRCTPESHRFLISEPIPTSPAPIWTSV